MHLTTIIYRYGKNACCKRYLPLTVRGKEGHFDSVMLNLHGSLNVKVNSFLVEHLVLTQGVTRITCT